MVYIWLHRCTMVNKPSFVHGSHRTMVNLPWFDFDHGLTVVVEPFLTHGRTTVTLTWSYHGTVVGTTVDFVMEVLYW